MKLTWAGQALLYANSDDRLRHVVTLTAGVVFLGSPLRGSKFQPFAQLVASLLRPAGADDGIVRDLACNNPVLRDKLHEFCRLSNILSIPITCFFELYESSYGKRIGFANSLKGMVWL